MRRTYTEHWEGDYGLGTSERASRCTSLVKTLPAEEINALFKRWRKPVVDVSVPQLAVNRSAAAPTPGREHPITGDDRDRP